MFAFIIKTPEETQKTRAMICAFGIHGLYMTIMVCLFGGKNCDESLIFKELERQD